MNQGTRDGTVTVVLDQLQETLYSCHAQVGARRFWRVLLEHY